MKTITLSGYVGVDITEQSLEEINMDSVEDVTLEINSYGGDYFTGMAIYNKLIEYKGKLVMDIIGMAGSAASLIVMAAEKENRKMRLGSRLFIHKPIAAAQGNSDDLGKTIEELKKMNDDVEKIYSQRMGLSVEQIRKYMEQQKSFTPAEAEKLGIAVAVKTAKSGKIKNYFKKLEGISAYYMSLPDEFDPSEVFHEFTTDPIEIEKVYECEYKTDEVINVNAIRAILATGENEQCEKLLNQFKAQNPHFKEHSKIEIAETYKGNKQTFLYTDKELTMSKQSEDFQKTILEVLGVDSVDEALEKIKAVKDRKDDGGGTEADKDLIARLQTELTDYKNKTETLSKAIEGLTEQIEKSITHMENEKIEKRDSEIKNLLETGYLAGETDVERMKTLWEADKITNLSTYPNEVKKLKAEGPRYIHLLKTQGSEGDELTNFEDSEEKGTATAQEVHAKIEMLKKENKDMTTGRALKKLEESDKELINRYYNGK